MPRRIPDYPDAYAGWNYVASIGSLISLMSVAILIWVFYSMCFVNPNKPNLKNNVWQTESYYSLAYNILANFFKIGGGSCIVLLLTTSKTNNSSLEFSIATPADYHSFTQAPIMGSLSLPLVGFASWAIMSIASLLTYIVIGGGLGNVYTETGYTLTQGLIFSLITGLIMSSIVYLLTIYNNSKVVANSSISNNLNAPDVSKWLYFSLITISAMLILVSPYLLYYSQIVNMLNSNLLKLTSLVNNYPTITLIKEFQGVRLYFSQYGSWPLSIFKIRGLYDYL